MNIHLPRLAEEQAQGLKTMKVSFSSTPVLPQVQATPQVGCPPRGASSHQCRAQRESYTNKQHVSASTKYRASLLLTFYEPKRVTGPHLSSGEQGNTSPACRPPEGRARWCGAGAMPVTRSVRLPLQLPFLSMFFWHVSMLIHVGLVSPHRSPVFHCMCHNISFPTDGFEGSFQFFVKTNNTAKKLNTGHFI